jgi:GntR family transcriptional regulator, transcriptional repressor for pyruvate dehydrogenase complex
MSEAAPHGGTRLADRVTRQLEDLIADEALQPGDLLPPERELCELMGVSRTVVREAVRSLVAKGLLEVRQGRGTIVRAPSLGLATDVITTMLRSRGGGRIAFARVQEVRRLLEVEIAGLAAERRTAEDLRDLDALLRRSVDAQTPEDWARADVDFHARLAEATHNLLFPVLLGSMAQIMMELRLTAAQLQGTQKEAQPFHEAIYEAVRTRLPAEARRAMRDHMAESEATFQRARLAGAISTLSSTEVRAIGGD